MAEFPVHTRDSAPQAAQPLIDSSVARYGMLPNLHAVLATAPEAYEAYETLGRLFGATSLSAAERHVVWLTINVVNRCHYCVPAHTMLALKDGVPRPVVDALRNGTALPDARLQALSHFTRSLVLARGDVAPAAVDAFLAAGFTERNVLEIVLGIAQKTLSNYTNHLAKTEVDPPFAAHDWTPPARDAAA